MFPGALSASVSSLDCVTYLGQGWWAAQPWELAAKLDVKEQEANPCHQELPVAFSVSASH